MQGFSQFGHSTATYSTSLTAPLSKSDTDSEMSPCHFVMSMSPPHLEHFSTGPMPGFVMLTLRWVYTFERPASRHSAEQKLAKVEEFLTSISGNPLPFENIVRALD